MKFSSINHTHYTCFVLSLVYEFREDEDYMRTRASVESKTTSLGAAADDCHIKRHF